MCRMETKMCYLFVIYNIRAQLIIIYSNTVPDLSEYVVYRCCTLYICRIFLQSHFKTAHHKFQLHTVIWYFVTSRSCCSVLLRTSGHTRFVYGKRKTRLRKILSVKYTKSIDEIRDQRYAILAGLFPEDSNIIITIVRGAAHADKPARIDRIF